mgnify:CR=1 FL=1
MKVVVVLPAYNCAKTLKMTITEIPEEFSGDIVLVDDCSSDETLEVAKECHIKHIIKHNKNLGYGANQKTCYDKALELKADIVIMLHPDYQYSPKLLPQIVKRIVEGADIVLASRMMNGAEAIKKGMPIYKYISNRMLTIFQNFCFRKHLSEYHTGYRGYRKDVLLSIKYQNLSNDFIFDNQIIIEAFSKGFDIQEIYCPARYDDLSSSIRFFRSVKYGCQVIYYTIKQLLLRR